MLTELIRGIPEQEYSFEKNVIDTHTKDWRGQFHGKCSLIVFPKSIQTLKKIVSRCNENLISIVPQGGNTSLVGGSVPSANGKEIIINLKNLNKIRNFDPLSFTITLESGCILSEAQKFVNQSNLYFPLSMGSRDSCQIGGNIASNAGGLNVIKYGTIRNNIIGIEAIMPDGNLYSNLKNIKKNNSGYDLKQLLIGSEGTLGIITAATVRLYPAANDSKIIFASFSKISKLLKFYSQIKKNFDDMLTSFEIINKDAMELVINNNPEISRILKKQNFFCLIEISNFGKENSLSSLDEQLLGFHNLASELIISKSLQENKKLWKIRELIPISEKSLEICFKHDISVPLNNMEEFIDKTTNQINEIDNSFKVINFGHIGDNNLHFNVFSIDKKKYKKLFKNKEKINNLVFSNTEILDGSFSAEHGIGQLRKKELRKFKSSFELSLMKKIKKNIDPNNIMNPGKIF